MLIFDAHLDMAWNALEWNRNLELPVHKIREFEKQFSGVDPGELLLELADLVDRQFEIAVPFEGIPGHVEVRVEDQHERSTGLTWRAPDVSPVGAFKGG